MREQELEARCAEFRRQRADHSSNADSKAVRWQDREARCAELQAEPSLLAVREFDDEIPKSITKEGLGLDVEDERTKLDELGTHLGVGSFM